AREGTDTVPRWARAARRRLLARLRAELVDLSVGRVALHVALRLAARRDRLRVAARRRRGDARRATRAAGAARAGRGDPPPRLSRRRVLGELAPDEDARLRAGIPHVARLRDAAKAARRLARTALLHVARHAALVGDLE